MNKKSLLLAILAIFTSYQEITAGATVYSPEALIENSTARIDTIRAGTAGGFNGYTAPPTSVTKLYITLVPSGGAVEANNVPTFSSYNGTTGALTYLPSTVKDVYIIGDATDWATLVLGNSGFGGYYYSPRFPAAAYGLPTPSAGTTVHFQLTNLPSVEPNLWFQGELPSGCRVSIEPNSQDPYLGTVLPVNGGQVFIGSPIETQPGFSAALNAISQPTTFTRHPAIQPKDASTKAVINLGEETIFPSKVEGISFAGAYEITFTAAGSAPSVFLVDVAADTAAAGINVGIDASVSAYAATPSTKPFPEFNVHIEGGNGSNFTKTLKNQAINITPALNY